MAIAVLIDTASIQPYIFGSNKLKENIGGSFIIERWIYREMIPKALAEARIDPVFDIDEWKSLSYKLQEDPKARVEAGYIGGGKALLLFSLQEEAEQFIKAYSRLILAYFPGIRTVFAQSGHFAYEGEPYISCMRDLNDRLVQNRSRHPMLSTPFKPGIVDDCPWSGEGQETFVQEGETKTWVSEISKRRINAVKASKEFLEDRFQDFLIDEGSQFKSTFTDDLGKLGQPEEKGYIAVVHADGNRMGERFFACKDLNETRTLSSSIAKLADEVMQKLIAEVVNLVKSKQLNADNGFQFEKDDDNCLLLPIRPLIMGGDDFTFVCEGKLGIYLAERLLKYIAEFDMPEKPISACAGIAIVHTKYPFYRAYRLASDLVDRAKEKSRLAPDSSWIHFWIAQGGFSGTLEEIEDRQNTLAGGIRLSMGPYQVDGIEAGIKFLKEGMRHFTHHPKQGGWPRNKQKELVDVLRKGEADIEYFMEEIKARELKLPAKTGKAFHKKLWDGNETPYFDMIELLDFYPKELLSL